MYSFVTAVLHVCPLRGLALVLFCNCCVTRGQQLRHQPHRLALVEQRSRPASHTRRTPLGVPWHDGSSGSTSPWKSRGPASRDRTAAPSMYTPPMQPFSRISRASRFASGHLHANHHQTFASSLDHVSTRCPAVHRQSLNGPQNTNLSGIFPECEHARSLH